MSIDGGMNITGEMDKANDLFQKGDLSAAETLCRQVLEVDIKNPRARHLLAFMALRQGQPKEARALFSEADDVGVENPLYFMHKGISESLCGDFEASVGSFSQAIGMNDSVAELHYNIGLSLSALHRHNEAIDAFSRAWKLDQKNPEIANSMGSVFAAEAKYEDALVWFEKALHLDPFCVQALNNKGAALNKIECYQEAVEPLMLAAEKAPESPEIYLNLGIALSLDKKAKGSIPYFRKALELNPQFAEAHANLASALEYAGETKDARSCAHKALELDPALGMAHIVCARCDIREGFYQDARESLEKALLCSLDLRMRISTLAELGNVLDKLDLCDDAFDYFVKSKALRQETAQWKAVDLDVYPNRIRQNFWFNAERVATWPRQAKEAPRNSPIFFVGFPRSGTTLLEQMLKAHPDLVSKGEHDWLYQLQASIPGTFPQNLSSLPETKIDELRDAYWEAAETVHGEIGKDKLLIDKNPINIINLGLVRRLFPDSKILVALRDPRDCVLSCYMQNFRLNPAMAQFYSLENSAKIYCETMKLALHYKEALGLDWYEYRYENLVRKPQETLKGILSFLGVDWDNKVLSYQEVSDERRVATPSIRDVAKPLFQTAKGRWMRYEKQLVNILPTLQEYVDYFGYASNERTAPTP